MVILYFEATSPNQLESAVSNSLNTGEERKNNTPKMLKSKWAIAMLVAVCDLNMTTINAVIVVPMLAPRMNGIALFNEIFELATNGMTNEVVIELDCIPAVSKVPQKKDLELFLKK